MSAILLLAFTTPTLVSRQNVRFYAPLTDPLMGVAPWKGSYDVYHTPPLLRVDATNGTRLRASWAQVVTILPWYYEQRTNSLQFFATRGHQQVIASYYDCAPESITNWLDASTSLPGVAGVMYTTWVSSYDELDLFNGYVSDWEIRNSWQLGVSVNHGGRCWRSCRRGSWYFFHSLRETARVSPRGRRG